MNARGVIAIVSCVVGLGLVFFGSVMGTKSPNQEASASGNPGANPQNKKPVRAWNMALGNVVVVDQELGFSVKAGKESHPQQGKLLTRIESRLQNLRELYREEGEKQPALMGGMTLQFSVNSAGEVTLVKEVSSRISDTEFKKAVIAEVSQWSFQDVVTDSVTVTCPLLFVREGMDITTLVQWEKTLGHFGEKTAVAKGIAVT